MKLLRFLVKLASGIVNFAVLAACLLLFSYGCYAVWDSQQLTQAADAKQYEIYKPTDEDTRSFVELQAINPDVFGWLNVYGTNIDYPLLQGEDNSKYVNTNVDGEYSLIGALFLDYRNKPDFSDFNSIIYGHHMAEDKMFGDIADFADRGFFDSHRYGSLFYEGKTHGIEFFTFLKVDAYDELYTPAVEGEENRQGYLEQIMEQAVYTRDLPVGTSDHLVLLSTCTSLLTNGRHILVGRITEEVQSDPFYEEEEKQLAGADAQDLLTHLTEIPLWLKVTIVLVLLLALGGAGYIVRRKWKKKR